MNQPTPPFNGAANALYGDRGPQRAHNTGRQEPQSLADHVDLALDRVKGLGPKQRLALHNELLRMLRDIEVIRLVAHSVRGAYGEAAVQDEEGRSRPSVCGCYTHPFFERAGIGLTYLQ
jgi:hypothetical protein